MAKDRGTRSKKEAPLKLTASCSWFKSHFARLPHSLQCTCSETIRQKSIAGEPVDSAVSKCLWLSTRSGTEEGMMPSMRTARVRKRQHERVCSISQKMYHVCDYRRYFGVRSHDHAFDECQEVDKWLFHESEQDCAATGHNGRHQDLKP